MVIRHDRALRERAVMYFDAGVGSAGVASLLGISRSITLKWYMTYRAVGAERLLNMGKSYQFYDYELKVAAARAVVDDGRTMVETMKAFHVTSYTTLNTWCHRYRVGGCEALKPKPKGRPLKALPAPPVSREQELERRVRFLEAENAYLKKLRALKVGQQYHGGSNPR